MNTGLAVPERPAGIELRSAVRFPLRMPVSVLAEQGEVAAMTVNISANGVLFEVAEPLRVSSIVQFTLQMPAEAMGTPSDVVVHCVGRVVRCTASLHNLHAAAVIDEYHFSQ